jgi:hypothetical protein
MTRAAIFGAVTLAIVASATVGAAGLQHVPLTDREIMGRVEHRLIEEGIRSITVAVQDRTVTLSGSGAAKGRGDRQGRLWRLQCRQQAALGRRREMTTSNDVRWIDRAVFGARRGA